MQLQAEQGLEVMSRRLPAQVDAIRFLVQAGCPASVQDNVASTPLHIAAGEGHIEAIKALKTLVITLLQKATLQASLNSMLGIAVCSSNAMSCI